MKRKPALALSFALLFALGLSATGEASVLSDRLDRPSSLTPLAIRSPLSDVQTIGNRHVMVGASGHILLREANGQVQQVQVPVDLLLTAVQFVDTDNGWAVGHDGVILHSNDGGHTWGKQLDGRQINPLLVSAAEAEIARLERAVDAAPDDEQLATALDNAHFAMDDAQAATDAGPARPLLALWFRDANEGWVVGAYGLLLKTVDGGATWAVVSGLDNPDRLHLNSVIGLDDGSLLVAGEGGRLYRSGDGGTQWDAVQQPTEASIYSLAELQNGDVMAAGFAGTLLVSHDHGATWLSRQLPLKVSLYGIRQLSSSAIVLAGQAGSLQYSEDGQHFEVWRAPGKAALLSVSETRTGQLLLVGAGGLQVLPMIPFKVQTK